MRIGKTLYVGLSRRTNVAGIQQLARFVEPFGYWVSPVEVRGCLHLKSACTFIRRRHRPGESRVARHGRLLWCAIPRRRRVPRRQRTAHRRDSLDAVVLSGKRACF
ncbi:MAG: hypothetical protein WDO18_00690 [Acidobacteriota bacterium]